MLSPVLILYIKRSTFEVVFAGTLPTLYFAWNVQLVEICITLVVLTRIFPERELRGLQRQLKPSFG